MRDSLLKAIVLTSFAALVATVGYLFWQQAIPLDVVTFPRIVTGPSRGDEASHEQPEPVGKTDTGRDTPKAARKQPQRAEVPDWSPGGRTVPVKALRVFPTPAEIRIGTQVRQMQSDYGQPSILVTGIRHGNIVQTLVFEAADRDRVVIVRAVNGYIISSETAHN